VKLKQIWKYKRFFGVAGCTCFGWLAVGAPLQILIGTHPGVKAGIRM